MADHDGDVPAAGFRFKPTLDGELMALRPVTVNDTNALLPTFQDAETTRLTGYHAEGEPDEARLRAWYGTRADHDDRLDLAVVEKATGDVVGEAVLNEWGGCRPDVDPRTGLVRAPGVTRAGWLGVVSQRLEDS
ncbi:GNAT family N-acetyltransferase [Streptomyces gibsoniae]|uniref:N-acetyltransferase n=1 Tax=Streptomyces gibsoniae TaxID=3075529 RepID=A0ABU2U8C9_9ACTN|nr:hypothetical protein [Streptomyces sp. DSM 41699]MDT0469491.1 hypothetical protein [Streptomyces sp. DSM 41699]